MTKRDVVLDAVQFRKPAYVPWSWIPTIESGQQLMKYLGLTELAGWLDNHTAATGIDLGGYVDVGNGCFRDEYGIVWDRSVDLDIGTPVDWPLKEPSDLARYRWPDVNNPQAYAHLPAFVRDNRHRLTVFDIGFSLYERAWTMRGMTDLLMDMIERPDFVHELLDAICDLNLIQIKHALAAGVDVIHNGDDYGMQTGLIMGIDNWRTFIKPRLARMYAPAKAAGKLVSMHSCGCVQSLFDDLTEIGLNIFNPFQPEVMNIFEMIPKYHNRLAFHGGMSVQKVLPFGSVADVKDMTRRLIDAGSQGGLIFAPSHAVPRDVSAEKLVAMVEVLKSQPGYGGK